MVVCDKDEFFPIEAIESILSQTFKDFEVVMIDNGSTGETRKIIDRYAERDSRIRILRNETNLGLTPALNQGIPLARGKYIARFDADDIMLPERLKKEARFLDENPSVDLVACHAKIIGEDGRETGEFIRPAADMKALRHSLFFRNLLVHSGIMARTESIRKIGGYDSRDLLYAQDYDLYFQMMKSGELAAIPEVLVLWRRRAKSISSQKRRNQEWCAFTARARAIRNGIYPWFYLFLLPIFLVKMILPIGFVRGVKNKIGR